ncbi:MAG: aspartate--ammonia ligase [Clostridiales bacterium]|nr:aspartate--ammonia ligase [Candidatus Crickella merdequi]
MSKVFIPEGYKPILGPTETQRAIKKIKDYFQAELSHRLRLGRVSAPLFVFPETGLNDNLNGYERRVNFTIKDLDEREVEVVQSLAKWKRMALGRYDVKPGVGLYTDMNAIRRDEELDNLHSIYVDQWDWEKVITADQRTEAFLEATVKNIYGALVSLAEYMNEAYPELNINLPEDITFVYSQDLEYEYPDLTSKEREKEAAKKYGAIFVKKIGGALKSGEPHDGRAPDYDDWELNGDIILWNEVLEDAFEISSMGIRVDSESMLRQLMIDGKEDRINMPFHQGVINNTLPLTIGGGIGQSRLCMYFLKKAHIGEVQVSVWPESMYDECAAGNIFLL